MGRLDVDGRRLRTFRYQRSVDCVFDEAMHSCGVGIRRESVKSVALMEAHRSAL